MVLSSLVSEFDVWREGYASAVVRIYAANTTTLLSVYSDVDLTSTVVNPQVLITKTDSLGVTYGKFATPIYVGAAYYLDINTIEQTGIRGIPLLTIAASDMSLGLVTATSASQARTAADRAADTIHALDYGAIGSSASTNTTTLQTAIGAAASNGGGRVLLPDGVIPFNQLTVPQYVILSGVDRNATTLQSQIEGRVIELTSDGAGLEDLTLDGVAQLPGSTGLYGLSIDRVQLRQVEIKRFHQGVMFRGGRDHVYRDVNITNNSVGISLRGDDDFVGAGAGDEFSGLDWVQGIVRQQVGGGLDITMFDMPARHNVIEQVDFVDNLIEPAVLLVGAAYTTLRSCYWSGNTRNLTVEDNPDATLTDRQVIGLTVDGGQMTAGAVQFDGLCRDSSIEHVELDGVDIQANVPENQIVLRDCVEDTVTITGDPTKVVRFRTSAAGSITGQTTSATGLVIWKTRLQPNEVVCVDAIVTAESITTTDHAAWSITHAARQPPAILNFDEGTAAFTVGKVLNGATSGARGRITAITGTTISGTLALADTSGTFVDNELLTETAGLGGARVNGTLTLGTNTLVGTIASPYAGVGALSWTAVFAVALQELQLVVTGEASKTINWVANIRMTAP